jgi:hypothetical protein
MRGLAQLDFAESKAVGIAESIIWQFQKTMIRNAIAKEETAGNKLEIKQR